MDRIVCTTTGQISYDTAGVRKHVELSQRLGTPNQLIYRCPSAALHPARPYHVGRRRNLHHSEHRAA